MKLRNEEKWVLQRWRSQGGGQWQDVTVSNPILSTEETLTSIKVTITYSTDYGPLTVEYLQRDGNNLKHTITFTNTSGGTETFRVIQQWNGIVGSKCNGKNIPTTDDSSVILKFHNENDPTVCARKV